MPQTLLVLSHEAEFAYFWGGVGGVEGGGKDMSRWIWGKTQEKPTETTQNHPKLKKNPKKAVTNKSKEFENISGHRKRWLNIYSNIGD